MSVARPSHSKAQAGTAQASAGEPPALGAALADYADALRDGVLRWLDLTAIELRQAGLSAAAMLGLALCAGLLCASAWVFLGAALAVVLTQLGVPMVLALVVVAALQLVAAAGALLLARRLSRRVSLPATRRQLALLVARSPVAGGH